MTELNRKLDIILRYIAADGDDELRKEISYEAAEAVGDIKIIHLEMLNKEIRAAIEMLLKELGCPTHLVGYRCAIEAISLVVEDREWLNGIGKGLFVEVGKRVGCNPRQIDRNLRTVIEVGYNRADSEAYARVFGNSVSPIRGRPSVLEFLSTCRDEIRRRMDFDI